MTVRGASGAALMVLGRAPAQLRGMSLSEIFRRSESLADALHFGTARPMHLLSGHRVRVEAGPCPGGAVGVIRRATDDDLELSNLASAIGHELRNAFASVMLAVQSLSRQDEVTSERGKRRLHLAERELRRIECALRGIQEIGRGQILRLIEAVPERLVAEALENLGPLESDRFSVKVPETLGAPAHLDSPRVCLAIEEAIRLGVRHLSGGGLVEVSVERRSTEVVFVISIRGKEGEERSLDDPSRPPDLALAVMQGVARTHGGHTEFIRHPSGCTILIVLPQRQGL